MTVDSDRSRMWRLEGGETVVVTLLAGVQEPGRVLVAADSLTSWESEGYGERMAKLEQVPNQDLVCGIYGNGAWDPVFRRYLEDERFESWGGLAYNVPYKVGELDLQSAPHGFDAIVAGRFKDQVHFQAFGHHLITDNDNPNSPSFAFIGKNRLVAKTAWDVANELAESTDLEERFLAVMERVVGNSKPYLQPPVHVWRVTPTHGCEHIHPVT